MNWNKGIVPMDEHQLILTERAQNDIIDIGDYISFTLSEPDISKKFIKGLRKSILQLKNFPYKFPLIQDDILLSQCIRYMPYKNYYIFYEVIETMQVVIILRIGYSKRNWKDILK